MLKVIGKIPETVARVLVAVFMWDAFLTEHLMRASGANKQADEFHEFNKYAWALLVPVLIAIGACAGALILLLPKR